MPAVIDDHVRASVGRGLLDLQASVALGGVEDEVGSAGAGCFASVGQWVEGNDGVGSGQAAELHGNQADGPEARDGYGVADADVSVAHGAEGKIRRIEADGRLPRDVCGQATHSFGPDVFFAERSVGEDAVAFFELRDVRT